MNTLDALALEVVRFISPSLEGIRFWLVLLAGNTLSKGGVLMLLFWAAWFATPSRRASLIATLGAAIVSCGCTHLLVSLLPHRDRPFLALSEARPGLFMSADDPGPFNAMNSMPSDHAALYVAIAVGLALVDRRIGACAIVHTLVIILGTRLLLGLHYLTDLLVGGLIGAAATVAAIRFAAGRPVESLRLMAVIEQRPALAYPALFLVTYQIADLFGPARVLAGALAR